MQFFFLSKSSLLLLFILSVTLIFTFLFSFLHDLYLFLSSGHHCPPLSLSPCLFLSLALPLFLIIFTFSSSCLLSLSLPISLFLSFQHFSLFSISLFLFILLLILVSHIFCSCPGKILYLSCVADYAYLKMKSSKRGEKHFDFFSFFFLKNR